MARQPQPGVLAVPRALRRLRPACRHRLPEGDGPAPRLPRRAAADRGHSRRSARAARGADAGRSRLSGRPARLPSRGVVGAAGRGARSDSREPRPVRGGTSRLLRLRTRPGRGPQALLPGGRAGGLLGGPRLDAAPGGHGEERPRLAGPALRAPPAADRNPGCDPGRRARPAGELGRHGPVADRPLGAQPRLGADQADDGRRRRGGLGLFAGGLPGRGRSRRRRGLRRAEGAGLASRHPDGHRHGPQPRRHRLAVGDRAPRLVHQPRPATVPELQLRRPRPVRRRAGRHFHRGPLLGPQRRGGGFPAA